MPRGSAKTTTPLLPAYTGLLHQGGQVFSQVDLLIHGLILVQIGAPVAEAGHGFAEKPLEGPGPKGCGALWEQTWRNFSWFCFRSSRLTSR